MWRPLSVLLCGLLGVLQAGCKSCDKVEAALRNTEEQLTQAREDLARQGTYTSALEHELRIIRGEVYAGQPGKSVAVFPVRSLVLGSQTGGHDAANGLGDDGLQIIFVPRDADSQPIQVPGEAFVQVLEISTEGHKRLLSSWYIDKDQIKASWKRGLLSQGYNVILPWKVAPSSENLRLVAQFRLEDGRVFETDKDVKIRLPKGTAARALPVVVSDQRPTSPVPNTSPTSPTPTLPAPKSPASTPPAPTPPTPVPVRPMPTPDAVLPMPKTTPMPAVNPGSTVVPPPPSIRTPAAPLPPKEKVPEGPSLGAKPFLDSAIKPAAVEIGRPSK